MDPDPGQDPDPYLWLVDPDPDPGGPKHVDPDSKHCLKPCAHVQKADPYFQLMDQDPAIFVSDVNKKFFFKFFCLLLFEGTIKSEKSKKSQNSRNQCFLTFFAWW